MDICCAADLELSIAKFLKELPGRFLNRRNVILMWHDVIDGDFEAVPHDAYFFFEENEEVTGF